MKQLIILVVSIQLVFFFPLQAILDKQNHHRMTAAASIVHASAQEARIEGMFTPEIRDNMLSQLEKYFDRSEIRYTLTETPKYRMPYFDDTETIHYEVIVPIDRIFVGNLFWGLDENENSLNYKIDGIVPSELLMR